MSKWITGRDPTNDELVVVFQRESYTCLGGHFLVTDGERVWISDFTRPPRGFGWYPGYWKSATGNPEIVAWMPLPKPPSPTNKMESDFMDPEPA